MKQIYLTAMAVCMTMITVTAQRKTFYTTAGGDGGIFSLATVKMNGRTVNPVLRYSPVFNFGANFNRDFSKNTGMFVGWNVRNIGLITDDNKALSQDRYKRRLYTFGVPLALKFGDLDEGNFFYAGGEVSMAVHYKEKRFAGADREKKEKFNEWFSDRTPRIMTAAFAGFRFKQHFNLKAQYYFTNFFNKEYNGSGGNYSTYEANPFFITFGYDFELKEIVKRKRK